jgi:hypothetical protein
MIPSHQPLLDGLTKKMGALKKVGVKSLEPIGPSTRSRQQEQRQ